MKIFIASDIHGSAFYCKKLLERINKEMPDRIILVGDILYHGPRNDLPKDYNPKEVIKMLNELTTPVSYTHLDVYKRQILYFYEY